MRVKNVAYISSINKDENEIKQQKELIQDYARRKSIKIDKYYIDNYFDRPELKQLLNDVKSRKITNTVIVNGISVIGEELMTSNKILHKLSKRNVDLISLNDEEALTLQVKQLLIKKMLRDQLERKKISQHFIDRQVSAGKCIVVPYAKDTREDIEYRREQMQKAKEQGNEDIYFVNRPQKRKKLGYVSYIRVANKSDEAVEIQKRIIENYAKLVNIKIDKYYIDNGYSGINLDRPGMKELIKDIENKNISKAIIVKNMDRLARDYTLMNKIISKSFDNKVHLLSTNPVEIEYINLLKTFSDESIKKTSNKLQKKEGEWKSQIIFSPYPKGSDEDIIFQQEREKFLKRSGINQVIFKHKEDRKREFNDKSECR